MNPGRTTFDARRTTRRGLTLAEVVVSTFLIGLLMTAALASVGAAARSTSSAAAASDGVALARQLLDEITALPYEDADQSPGFGLESGESAAPGARTHCDDMDDLNDWVDSPPKDKSGAAIAGYAGWQRTADVQKVDDDDHGIRGDNSSDEGVRLATVVVTSPEGTVATLHAYRTKDAGSLQPQGVEQNLVTWVGITLQSGAGDPVVAGSSLINHATDQ